LPSSDRRRQLKCQACGKGYDLSDACKVSSMLGGLGGMGLTIILFFGRIVKAGQGSKLYIGFGTIAVVLGFALGAMALARITLRLEPRP
jgi:high-affinity Fe2+/Pb2+ permease